MTYRAITPMLIGKGSTALERVRLGQGIHRDIILAKPSADTIGRQCPPPCGVLTWFIFATVTPSVARTRHATN